MVHLCGTAGSLTSACLLLLTPHPILTWLSHTHRNLLEHGLLRPNSHSPDLVCQYFAAHHATELLNKIHVWPLTSVQTWGWIWFPTHCRRQGSSRWPWWCGRCLPNSPAGYASACCLGTAREISETNHRASGNGVLTDTGSIKTVQCRFCVSTLFLCTWVSWGNNASSAPTCL